MKMRLHWLVLALMAGSLHAVVVIKGTVVENESGHPLARAVTEAAADRHQQVIQGLHQ